MKKICFILCFLSVYFLGNGQTITIDNATFDLGPYGQGSTVAVPVTLNTDCFNVGNVFNLYLSDNSGNFVGNGTLIGSFSGFFTTYVNGIIPNGTASGTGYRLRVVSTNPVAIASNTTNAFVINASVGVVAKANPTSQDFILADQKYFGWCSNIQNNTINLINQSTAGATVTATLKNESTGVTSIPTLNSNQFGIPVNQNYYTITIKAVNGVNVGTFSYFIINTPNKMVLSTFGEQRGCLPNNLDFQFITNSAIGIGDNFPGTQYRVDWGDGSTTFYKHCELIKQNGAISHPYTTTSCTQIGGAFSVTATLQNPFFVSSGTQSQQNCDQPQINTKARVFLKPTANFTFPQYACENTLTTFSNTSLPGQGQNGTSCVSAAKYGWYVNDVLVNPTTSDIYQSAPLALNYTFTTPGKYAIKLSVYNGSCDTSFKVDTICIEPRPVPNFTFTTGACVATSSFTPINTTNINPCRPMTFNWSVLDSTGLPTVPSGNYTISSITAAQPLITILKPGKYQIQLCASNACGIVCKNESLTVAGTPIATLPTGQTYCGVKTIDFGTDINHRPTYDSQFGNTPTYTWFVSNPIGGTSSFVGGTTATSAFPQIQFDSIGTYVVQLTYSNNCGVATTVSQQITFNRIPTFTITPSSQIVCGGLTTLPINFTSTPAGAGFTWINDNASLGLAASGNGNVNSFTTTKPTTQQLATISITPTLNGCPGLASTATITVNPTPVVPTASTSVALCQNVATVPLTAAALAGDTLKWYDASNTLLPNAPTPSVTTIGTTIYYVSQINTTTNCESDKLAISVNVNAATTIDTLSTSNPTICQSATGSITIKGLLANTGYTLNYNRNGITIGPLNIISDGSGYYAITGLSFGTYDNIKVGANNCASNALGPINLTDPNPPATPVATASDSTICSGTTLSLQAISATPGVTYNWSGSDGFINTNQNPSITNATILASGTYIVNVTLNGCTSANGTVSIVVNQTPAPPVTTDSIEYCQFITPVPLTATSTTGNSLQWYTVAIGGAASNTAPTPVTTTNGVTSYYVSQINTTSNCESSRTPIVVTVSQNTTIDTLSTSNPTACQGVNGTIVLQGLTAGRTYTLDYNKNNVPVSATSFTATGNTYTISGLSAGTYSNIVISLNGCQSNTFGPVVLSDPNAPVKPVATYNGAICSDSTIILNATSATGGVSFDWVGPNGFTATNIASPTIPNATVVMSGNYIVVATLNGCTSISDTVVVVVNQTPVTPTVTSNSPVCEGNTINLTAITSTIGTIAYTWSGPSGFASGVQNPIITNATSARSGFYAVFATNTTGNCNSKSDSVSVTVNGALTNTITGTPQSICATQLVTIIGQPPVGGGGSYTYQWQQSADSITWVDISGAAASNVTFSPTDTVYVRRVVFSSTCTAPSNAALITVLPAIGNNIISKDSAICIGATAPTLVGTVPTGGNSTYAYTWENSTNGGTTWLPIASANAKDYLPAAIPSATIQYRRIVTSSLCTGPQADTSNVVTITVNPHAKALYTYNTDVSCAVFDIAANVQNILDPANGSYQWYANNTLIGTGATMPAYSITNGFDSVVIKLKAISLYGCNNDSLEHKFYTSPSPIPSFTVSDSVGCGPLNVSFTNTTTFGNLFNYSWNFGTGATSTAVSPTGILFPINPTRFDSIYTVTLSALSTCQTVTATKVIRVKSKPQALFTPNKSVGCSPFNATFNNTSRGSNVTYIWDFGDGSAPITTTSSNAQLHTYNTGVQDTFNVKLIATNDCGSDTITYNIIVSPNTIKLDFAVNATDVTSCLPSTVRFVNNTIGATSFNWDFGDGNVLTTTKNVDTVTHVYTTAGTFITKLTASNGCSDTTDFEQIQAFAKPIVKFTASPLAACLGDSIRFVNQTDTATGYTWRYGNGVTASLTSPTYVYNAVGTYNAQLVAVRQYATITCSDSAATTINVVAKLTGSFKLSDSVSTCVPFNVIFTNLSVPSALTTWDYGDGVKDTGDLVQHTYTTSGTFTAKMTAVNAGGCTYETTKNIVVQGPTGTWIYDKGLICAKKSVQFQVNALNADSLRFNFGDGTSLTTTSPIVNHTYTQSGNYLPSVQLLSGASCFVTLQGVDTIKIENIKAGFTTVQQKTCGSTTVGFADTSRSFYGVQTWQWNYGDGSPVGTTQNTQHTYTVGNMYGIQLIIVGNSGCTDTASLQLPITINSRPNATIQANAISCANQSVSYSATITSVDSVVLKLWRFATGATAIGNTAAYTYTTAGTYTTAFITGTINGCFDTTYNTITVNPSPTLVASADVTICRGASTPLLATGSSNIVWSPATGLSCTTCSNPSAFPTVTTAYVASSTNGFGCTSTDTVVVTVVQPFTITVTPSDSICIGQSTRLGASGAFSYTWSPATGLNNAAIQNPVASPVVTTTYQVTGSDQFNCFTATASVVIGVGDYPVVNLGQDQVLAAGSTYTFTPSVTNGPIANWLWTPSANLDCTTCPSVTATAKTDVCYVASATNIYGCASTDTVCIKVFCESSQVFIPNAFMPGTGTGKNDILMVRSTGIKLVKSFRIYNRWGQVVFERANFVPNDRTYGWNGLIQGKPANTDVYIYTCEVVCENDTPFVYKGNVAIIR